MGTPLGVTVDRSKGVLAKGGTSGKAATYSAQAILGHTSDSFSAGRGTGVAPLTACKVLDHFNFTKTPSSIGSAAFCRVSAVTRTPKREGPVSPVWRTSPPLVSSRHVSPHLWLTPGPHPPTAVWESLYVLPVP